MGGPGPLNCPQRVLRAYLELCPDEPAEADAVLVRDVCKEALPRVRCALAGAEVARARARVAQSVALRGTDLFDAEVLYLLQPAALHAFAVSRALVAQRSRWDAGAALKLCRSCPLLLHALVLTVLPRPHLLGGGSRRDEALTPHDRDSIVGLLLGNQGWLGLWELPPWLLAQLAAVSQSFAHALVSRVGK